MAKPPDLSPAARALLQHHRKRAFDVLLQAVSSYDGGPLKESPNGRGLLGQDRDLLVSVAVSASDAATTWLQMKMDSEFATSLEPEDEDGPTTMLATELADRFPDLVIESLRRYVLPYTSLDACLLLELGCRRLHPGVVGVALTASSQVLVGHPMEPTVLEGLQRLVDVLEEASVNLYGVTELRQRARSMLAAQTPGGLLDLSPIDIRDDWGPRAREVLEVAAEAWPAAQSLLVQLSAARQARASTQWHRAVEALVSGSTDAAAVLQRLLELLVTANLSVTPPAERGVTGASTWLIAPGNAVILRGAALASVYVDAAWVAPLLAQVALRGAASHPQPLVTTALCAKAATGAIDALAGRARNGDDGAHAQLVELFAEIRRRDLVKRIGLVLDASESAVVSRTTELRRVKQRAVAAKAAPGPKTAQSVLNAYVRRLIAPRLREAGFQQLRGRTYVRIEPGFVVGVSLGVSGPDAIAELGIRYAELHEQLPDLHSLRLSRLTIWQFDIRGWIVGPNGGDRWPLKLDQGGDAEVAAQLATAILERGLLWLASWGNLDSAIARIRSGEGPDVGVRNSLLSPAYLLDRLEEPRGEAT